ncbi:hypothetical protein [Shewanella psychropiezotolerans]|uniref:hypothetical protein n=1 Tax=Shewanella psychropiezotolerans TaxID=2593655 RepID=UPI001E4EEBBE|nr:hypothetical protein [Shewanella psychropiezotolerans]
MTNSRLDSEIDTKAEPRAIDDTLTTASNGTPTVLITGASKGVGAACVHGFAKAFPEGVNLVLVARGLAGYKS